MRAGMYVHSKNEGECRVWYAPEWAQKSMPTMQYIILHEFGHVLRYHGLTDTRLRAKWLKLYNQSFAKNVVEKASLKSYLRSLIEMHSSDDQASFQECLRNITAESEEDQKNVHAVLKWVRDIHRLSAGDGALQPAALRVIEVQGVFDAESCWHGCYQYESLMG